MLDPTGVREKLAVPGPAGTWGACCLLLKVESHTGHLRQVCPHLFMGITPWLWRAAVSITSMGCTWNREPTGPS